MQYILNCQVMASSINQSSDRHAVRQAHTNQVCHIASQTYTIRMFQAVAIWTIKPKRKEAGKHRDNKVEIQS